MGSVADAGKAKELEDLDRVHAGLGAFLESLVAAASGGNGLLVVLQRLLVLAVKSTDVPRREVAGVGP